MVKKLKMLLVLVFVSFLAGCATGNRAGSGMMSTSREVGPAKSSPGVVSFGGESRMRTNLWTRPR